MNKMKLLQQNKVALVLHIILSCVGACGLCHLGVWMGLGKAGLAVVGVLSAVMIWLLLGQARTEITQMTDSREKRRRIIFAFIVSFLFSLSLLMGYQLQINGMTGSGFAGKGKLLLWALCLSVSFFPLANAVFHGADRIKSAEKCTAQKWHSTAVFAGCATGIFLCLIPVWLAFYPIIMSYDFHRQINEAYNGFAYFFPYQPIAHTWLIWVFLQLGEALGSLETGFGYMALFQILLYALVMGYSCTMLYRITRKRWLVVLGALFFGLFPFNTVLVVCTTKDTLFTILFALFVLLLLEYTLFSKDDSGKKVLHKKNVIALLLVLEGCLMQQFRNNAFYAVAVFMVLFLFMVPKKEKLRTLILCILLIVGGKWTGVAIKEAIGTQLSLSKVEMFSVPIQQFARVGYYHRDFMDETTYNELDKYIPADIWANYYPSLADGVKAFANAESFLEYGELAAFWGRLGLQYPNEYIDAFLELTRGYWFIGDTSWAENMGSGAETRMGAIFTYNSSEIMGLGQSIRHESKFPWLEERLVEIVSCNAFFDWPVLSLIFRCAFYPWTMFLITMVYLYKRQRMQWKLSLLPWIYFGTVLLGPVAWIRYVFPIMVLIPLMGAMLLWKEEEKNV